MPDEMEENDMAKAFWREKKKKKFNDVDQINFHFISILDEVNHLSSYNWRASLCKQCYTPCKQWWLYP